MNEDRKKEKEEMLDVKAFLKIQGTYREKKSGAMSFKFL
jgi:hypothetical protein